MLSWSYSRWWRKVGKESRRYWRLVRFSRGSMKSIRMSIYKNNRWQCYCSRVCWTRTIGS